MRLPERSQEVWNRSPESSGIFWKVGEYGILAGVDTLPGVTTSPQHLELYSTMDHHEGVISGALLDILPAASGEALRLFAEMLLKRRLLVLSYNDRMILGLTPRRYVAAQDGYSLASSPAHPEVGRAYTQHGEEQHLTAKSREAVLGVSGRWGLSLATLEE